MQITQTNNYTPKTHYRRVDMLEFIPWNKKVLNETLEAHKQGNLSVLDLELSACCTKAHCIYCDSKPAVGRAQLGEFSWDQLENFLIQCKSLGLQWIYTCGLGEPMEDTNFYRLIDFIGNQNINLSMFTNGLFINDIEKAELLKKAGVNIVLKLDTFDNQNFDIILGEQGLANKIYQANNYLLEAGYGSKDGYYTDLAYSIVPTAYSFEGIPAVIDFAEKNGVFASIGELESAGLMNDKVEHGSLDVSFAQKEILKQKIDLYAKGKYKRPMCPAIIAGIHIDNTGNCIVDKLSGLNCKWFLLTEPDPKILGNIKNDSALELFNRVLTYRRNALTNNKEIIMSYAHQKFVFGGCGGNIFDVINIAYDLL